MPKIYCVTKRWTYGVLPQPPPLDRVMIQWWIETGRLEAYLQNFIAICHIRFLAALCEEWLIIRERMFGVKRETWIDGLAPKSWGTLPKGEAVELTTALIMHRRPKWCEPYKMDYLGALEKAYHDVVRTKGRFVFDEVVTAKRLRIFNQAMPKVLATGHAFQFFYSGRSWPREKVNLEQLYEASPLLTVEQITTKSRHSNTADNTPPTAEESPTSVDSNDSEAGYVGTSPDTIFSKPFKTDDWYDDELLSALIEEAHNSPIARGSAILAGWMGEPSWHQEGAEDWVDQPATPAADSSGVPDDASDRHSPAPQTMGYEIPAWTQGQASY